MCIDTGAALIKGAGEHLPNAHITFDKFHAARLSGMPSARRAAPNGRAAANWPKIATSG